MALPQKSEIILGIGSVQGAVATWSTMGVKIVRRYRMLITDQVATAPCTDPIPSATPTLRQSPDRSYKSYKTYLNYMTHLQRCFTNFLFLGFSKVVQLFAQWRAAVSENRGGKKGGIYGAWFSDGQRGNRDSARHLHRRK